MTTVALDSVEISLQMEPWFLKNGGFAHARLQFFLADVQTTGSLVRSLPL